MEVCLNLMWKFFTEAILESLRDTIITLPILVLLFFIIENFEHRYGGEMREKLAHLGKGGPLWGAIFGAIPQCSFSVLATALFGEGLVSTGTLLAVYIATSDEAIPVIMSHPAKAGLVVPLLVVKVFLAILAGFAVDWGMRRRRDRRVPRAYHPITVQTAVPEVAAEDASYGCCGHDCTVETKVSSTFHHALDHAFRIYGYILAITILIAFGVQAIGQEGLRRVLLYHTPWQPLVTGVLGLIPNCAISVALAEGFLRGDLSFAAMLAGLATNAGVGLIPLFHDQENRGRAFKVVALLLVVGVGAGFVLEMFPSLVSWLF